MKENAHKYILGSYLVLALLGITIFRAWGPQFLELLPSAVTRDQPLSWHLVLSMALFVALLAGGVFFSSPVNALFYLAAGYFFGFLSGVILATLATVLGSGAALCFFSKTIRLPATAKKLEVKRVFLVLVLLRCSPWMPSSLINLFCGVARVPLPVFLASTLFGTLPLVLVYTLAASRLRGPITVSLLYSPAILTAVSVLGVLSLVGFLEPLRVVMSYLRRLAFPAPRVDGHQSDGILP